MNYEKVYLEQGSAEWHEARAVHANASEAGAIMNAGKYFPRTMAELLSVKRGESTVFQSDAMKRGNELEPVALKILSSLVGIEFSPCVIRLGRRQASLDGIDFHDSVGAEIKCPMKADSDLFRATGPGTLRDINPQYYWQVVAQFYCTGIKALWFFPYHPDVEPMPFVIERDDVAGDFDAWAAASEQYLAHLDAGTTPESERTDAEWEVAVMEYRTAKTMADEYAAQVEDAKKRLQSLGGGKGFGLSVTRVAGKKTTEYAKAIKALCPDADLTPWQKVGEPSWSVREIKEKQA